MDADKIRRALARDREVLDDWRFHSDERGLFCEHFRALVAVAEAAVALDRTGEGMEPWWAEWHYASSLDEYDGAWGCLVCGECGTKNEPLDLRPDWHAPGCPALALDAAIAALADGDE